MMEAMSAPSSLPQRFPLLPRLRTAIVAFALFAVFAISPLGQYVDRETYLRPLRPGMTGFWFVRELLDHIASQRGEGVVLAILAIVLTFVMRSSLPLVIGGITEGLFYATGLLKLLFAKDAPRFGHPLYWDGGYLRHGKFGMAFPSGHTSEVVLVFGAVVLLLHVGLPRWSARHLRSIRVVWIVVAINACMVSWAIGTHWATDLIGGFFAGAVMLRILVSSVARGYASAIAARIDAAAAVVGGRTAGAIGSIIMGPRSKHATPPVPPVPAELPDPSAEGSKTPQPSTVSSA